SLVILPGAHIHIHEPKWKKKRKSRETCVERREWDLTLLLHVASLTLEVGPKRPAVHQHVARDDANGFALGQHVEQSRLAGSGGAHQGGQGTRFDPARDVVQQPALALFDVDVIDDVLPGEDVTLWLDAGTFEILRSLF